MPLEAIAQDSTIDLLTPWNLNLPRSSIVYFARDWPKYQSLARARHEMCTCTTDKIVLLF